MNEVVEKILRKTPLFASLTDKEMDALAGRVSNRRFERGALLGRFGSLSCRQQDASRFWPSRDPGVLSRSFPCLMEATILLQRLR